MACDTPVVSADSHVIEPPDLWSRRLPARLRLRAPRLVEAPDVGLIFVAEGCAPALMNNMTAAGRSAVGREGFASLRAGGFEAGPRLDDADLDGVVAEILYPSAGLLLFEASDDDYRRACFRVYNDWLAEFCAAAPGRLFGVAALDVSDPAMAADELLRSREAGLVGGLVPGRPPAGHYGEGRFDPLWRTAAAARIPISIHAFSDRWSSELLGPGIPFASVTSPIHLVQLTLELLIGSGVLRRHPDLRLVFSEFDAGWVPHFLDRLDKMADRPRGLVGDDAEPPSAPIRRQVSFGFQEDKAAVALWDAIGTNALLWGSDYPHRASTWPNSIAVLREMMDGVPAEARAQIAGGNVIALYDLAPVPSTEKPMDKGD